MKTGYFRGYFYISAIILGIGCSFNANAADVVRHVPAVEMAPVPILSPSPVKTWEGGYAGISGGKTFKGQNPGDGLTRMDGYFGGIFVGTNFQNGNVVYGVEGDLGYDRLKGSQGAYSFKGGVDGSARARLGYALTDSVLLYGTAGGAAQRLSVAEASKSDTNTMLGWTAGVGVDAKLTDSVFGRVEYRYTDFGSKTFSTGSGNSEVGARGGKIKVGLGIQF
ncbi:outer membrane protein [Nitratireductor indicus]|uniref:outer membrane protein n=1 Tax=Nitratireductor indicus TaxID=721133 RepID=UPI002876858B|nr:outer membrane beta-barrel protein [Nitratireductor indicus]MDS1134754.1 outer membrane beta-barrel protein [Nitratireductor indicus]